MLNNDCTIKAVLFTKDKIHLSESGYGLYAKKLRPVVDALLADVKK
jgi:lysophospholipase L1-like esterase